MLHDLAPAGVPLSQPICLCAFRVRTSWSWSPFLAERACAPCDPELARRSVSNSEPVLCVHSLPLSCRLCFQFVDEGSPKFTFRGPSKDVTLFQCRLKNGTKIWNLSTITKPNKPGTNSDIDYYSAPCKTRQDAELPSTDNWKIFGTGVDPSKCIAGSDGQSVLAGFACGGSTGKLSMYGQPFEFILKSRLAASASSSNTPMFCSGCVTDGSLRSHHCCASLSLLLWGHDPDQQFLPLSVSRTPDRE